MDPLERKSSSLPATGARGDHTRGHAAMQSPTSETPMDQNEAVYRCILCAIMFLCDSRLPFFASRRAPSRACRLGIKFTARRAGLTSHIGVDGAILAP